MNVEFLFLRTRKGPSLEKGQVLAVSPGLLVATTELGLLEGERTFCEHLLDATDLNSSDLVLRVCISRVCQSKLPFLGPSRERLCQ